MTITAAAVLRFWTEEIGEDGWYAGTPEIDAACRDRLGAAWDAARAGAFRDWCARADGTLAYLILTDQIPRNIHRGTAAAFATDRLALAAAVSAMARGHDLRIGGALRQFFYMPFEHAESVAWQDRSVRLFLTRYDENPALPDTNLLHARAHREIIRRFGRFPTRNAALGRASSPAEAAFLAEGGYGAMVQQLKAA